MHWIHKGHWIFLVTNLAHPTHVSFYTSACSHDTHRKIVGYVLRNTGNCRHDFRSTPCLHWVTHPLFLIKDTVYIHLAQMHMCFSAVATWDWYVAGNIHWCKMLIYTLYLLNISFCIQPPFEKNNHILDERVWWPSLMPNEKLNQHTR